MTTEFKNQYDQFLGVRQNNTSIPHRYGTTAPWLPSHIFAAYEIVREHVTGNSIAGTYQNSRK